MLPQKTPSMRRRIAVTENSHYSARAIGELLMDAFDVEGLRGLFTFARNHDLHLVADQFTPEDSKPTMVRKAFGYCQRYHLLDELLDQVKENNRRAYDDWSARLASPLPEGKPNAASGDDVVRGESNAMNLREYNIVGVLPLDDEERYASLYKVFSGGCVRILKALESGQVAHAYILRQWVYPELHLAENVARAFEGELHYRLEYLRLHGVLDHVGPTEFEITPLGRWFLEQARRKRDYPNELFGS
jgi:hypothetical protein